MASIDLIRASNGSGDAVKATVANARVISSTTLQVDATTNWPSKFIATVGDVDGAGVFVPATVTVFNGILSGGNIEITSFAPGYTDLGNAPGQIVVLKPTTAWSNEIANTLGVAHNDNGSLKANSVTSTALADRAVTADKIDFTTLAFGNYSTSEVDTGFKWIDGKTIYKKTINFGALPNNTSKSVAHGISGLSRVMSIETEAYEAAGPYYYTFGHVNTNTLANGIAIYVDGTNIVISTGSNRTGITANITLSYTK